MCYPLISIIEKKKKIEATKSDIVKSYKKYCKYWQGSSDNLKMIVPLHNLVCSFDKYKFDKAISIETMTDEYKTKIYRLTSGSVFDEAPTQWDIYKCSHILTWAFYSPKKRVSYNWEETAGRMLTALRLFRTGDVGSKYKITENIGPKTSFSGFQGSPLSGFWWVPAEGKKYQINKSELPSVHKIYNDLNKLDQIGKLPKLNVALRRFNQSYSRKLPEDKIIDLTIALESILLFSETDELQNKLATRGARILQKKTDPLKTRDTLKLLYTLRSSIVHEGQTLTSPSKSIKKKINKFDSTLHPPKMADVCENIVRAVIMEYVTRLQKNNSIQEINQQIDDEMILS